MRSRKRIFEMSGATSEDDVESTVLCAIGVVSKTVGRSHERHRGDGICSAVETTALADLAKVIEEMRREMAARDKEMAAHSGKRCI